MTDRFIDRAYKSSGNAQMRALYDEWASQYDEDLTGQSYQTPLRVADTLGDWLTDKDAPVLDYGCGTGLSGAALAAAGFTRIDGADLSQNMLARAREKGVYQRLFEIDPDQDLPFRPGTYAAITAVGVISAGAAPGAVYDALVQCLAPGAVFVLSLNDQSLKMDAYAGRLSASVDAGLVRILSENYGPHVSKHGANSGATIYVLERLD